MSQRSKGALPVTKEIGTLAIDLGNTTTVVAFQGEKDKNPRLLDLPTITRTKGEIPSLVWHNENCMPNLLIGQDVVEANLVGQNNPFLIRDFKRWIGIPPSEVTEKFHIPPNKAGEALLRAVWEKIPHELEIRRLVLTTPVESYRAYKSWLNQICSEIPVNEIAIVDEPTAAAIGAGMHAGSKLLVCDFGGSTIDIALVAIEGGEGKASPIAELVRFNGQDLQVSSRQVLRCAKVLGKSGIRLGGRDLDRWIANHLFPERTLTENLLDSAEKLKCRLSQISIPKTEQLIETAEEKESGRKYLLKLNRNDLEEVLIKNQLFEALDRILEKTLAGGRKYGCELSDLAGVVAVGGGSQVPLIREWLKKRTTPAPFLTPPPTEAVAIGALALTPGVRIKDVLQKSVYLRCWDQKSEKHIWHPLFLNGQTWPTSEGLEIVLAGSKENQKSLEIVLGETESQGNHEVVYINGIPTVKSSSKATDLAVINGDPINISLNPPTQPGEDCIRLNFSINEKAKLKMIGIDLRTGQEIETKYLTTVD